MNLDFTGSTLFLVLLLFAAGLVCVLLLPIIEAFQNRSKE